MKTVYLTHPYTYDDDKKEKLVMALGFFDGVHRGHQKVILEAKKIAEQLGCKSAVMTFYPHPSVVLKREKEVVQYITPLQQKVEEMARLGIDYLFIVEFTEAFSQLTPQQFVDDYIIGLNVIHVVAGFDYSYGKLGKGTMETMPFHSRNMFTQTVIESVDENNEKISSTSIRKFLKEGNLEQVKELLGRHLMMRGKVVDGDKRGRTIGFPTANVELHSSWLLPPKGVYAVKVNVGEKWYNGMCNVGYKPTFYEDEIKLTVEANLFDFHEDIYGEIVEIQWHKRLRDERKFNGIQELISQLQQDKLDAMEYFQTLKEDLAFQE
ncbi:MAG: bifunctional riboflavin kinase/FAD synthetase [Bacillaceae bacterium]